MEEEERRRRVAFASPSICRHVLKMPSIDSLDADDDTEDLDLQLEDGAENSDLDLQPADGDLQFINDQSLEHLLFFISTA